MIQPNGIRAQYLCNPSFEQPLQTEEKNLLKRPRDNLLDSPEQNKHQKLSQTFSPKSTAEETSLLTSWVVKSKPSSPFKQAAQEIIEIDSDSDEEAQSPTSSDLLRIIKENPAEILFNSGLQDLLVNLIYSGKLSLQKEVILSLITDLPAKALEKDQYAWILLKYNHKILTKEIFDTTHQRSIQGFAAAQNNLAFIYEKGLATSLGIPKNETKAIELYKKAAFKGLARAQNSLAEMYKEGRGIKQFEDKSAFLLFTKSERQGFVPAKQNLGDMYESGRGVSKNEAKAFELYKEGSDLGCDQAQTKLASVYAYGLLNIPKDLVKAASLYNKASDQGNPRAQNNLGEMYENGRGVPQDFAKACALYKKAYDKEFPRAQINYRRMCENGFAALEIKEKIVEPSIKVKEISKEIQKKPTIVRTNKIVLSNVHSPIIKTAPISETRKPALAISLIEKSQKMPEKTSAPSKPSVQKNQAVPYCKEIHQNKCKVSHISGTEMHFQLLQKALRSAKDNILITSHSITWIPNEVYKLLLDTLDRGIKIHIVYNKEIDPQVEDFFSESGIRSEQNSVHGKYLVVDKKHFVVGSYNWLDFRNIDDDGIGESYDQSFKISKNEKYVNQLRGKVWSEIISHRSGPSEKKWNFKELSVSSDSNLLLLTTLFDHENFLLSACRDAKRKIEIHSPFVTYKNAIKRLNDIANTLNVNVKLHLVIGETYEELDRFIKNHHILRQNTKIYLDESHRKTLLIDDELISEGSFNWLSSANSLGSEFHNQDASLVLRGPIARDII